MPETETPSPQTPGTLTPSQVSGNEADGRDNSPGAAPDRYEQMLKESPQTLLEEIRSRNRDLAASKQEAEKLHKERDAEAQKALQYENYLRQLALSQQAQQQQQQRTVTDKPQQSGSDDDVMSDAEAEALSNAIIGNDKAEIRRLDRLKTERLRGSLKRESLVERQKQYEDQASMAALQEVGWTDLQSNPALAKEAGDAYARILNSPRAYTYKSAPLGNSGYDANILREAILEARAKLGSVHKSAEDAQRASSDNFIEPSSRQAQPVPGSQGTTNKSFSEKLLFDYEVSACGPGKLYESTEKYWANLHPDIKKERLRRGEPVKAAQLGMLEVKYT